MNMFLKKILLICCIVCFVPALVLAEESITQYNSGRFGVSFNYPSEYKSLNSDEFQKLAGNVPILVVANNEGVASFNMIVEIGEFDIQQSVLKIADKVIKEYKAIGITNVAASAPQTISTNVGTVFNTELFYTENSNEMYSNVSIIPAGEKHFILTFISSDVNQQKKIKEDVRKILGSVKFLTDNVPTETKEIPTSETKSAVPYILCLIVLAFIAIFSSDKRNIGEDSGKEKE